MCAHLGQNAKFLLILKFEKAPLTGGRRANDFV